ncbi:cation diffusion facilitator family transporter [Alteromonas sp. a30]|uniref:cation diffusion facilitator family transporter n=1 Tax=Alteromonas sp. a30 TaxID=2730917 RepID=UPI002280082E|nr:cation diffusion facilitator family transporter [Alteromonas sp. a30]MCY7296437.1 cation transporter [Alteromonas sp. a30]
MKVRQVLFIEGAVNVLIALIKLVVGLMVQSTAIIADAAHSLTDVANNGLAYIAIQYSEKPADEDHRYGHHKYETLAIFALAMSLVIVAFEVITSAIERFNSTPEHSNVGLWLMVICILINTALTTWEHHWAKKLNSSLLHADAKHTFSDVLTSIAIIVGWQIASRGYPWVDALFAIFVALIIVYFAYSLFKQAIPVLVDSTFLDEVKVKEAIHAIPKVKDVDRIRSRYDGKHLSVDVIISVEPQLSTQESHRVADKVEHLLATSFDAHDILVHVEPSTSNKEKPPL